MITDDFGRSIKLTIYREREIVADIPLDASFALVLAGRLTEAVTRHLRNLEEGVKTDG